MTHNHWDSLIDPALLWIQYERIITDNGVIALFGQDKFTARMMLSNEKLHRYNLVWDKSLPSGFLNANRMPLRVHEDIMIFYKHLPTYNPQFTEGKPIHASKSLSKKNNNYGKFTHRRIEKTDITKKFPKSILSFPKPHPSTCVHPTQKPVELLEWLIKTYTNENELVLDNVFGSCSTGIACLKTNRNFIGMEKDSEYFKIGKERIENYIKENVLTIEYIA